MRSILTATVLGLVVLGCASDKGATQATPTTPPTVSETRTGLVIAVRPQELQLFSPDAAGDKTIWLQRNESTEISRDGMQLSWTSIGEGTPVRVSFEPAAGAEKATRIEVLTGPEAEEAIRSSLGQAQEQGAAQQAPDTGGTGMDQPGEEKQDSGE